MKALHVICLFMLTSFYGFSQEIQLPKETYSKKEIRSFKSMDLKNQRTVFEIIHAEFEWVENSGKQSLQIAGNLTAEQVNNARNYTDLGILPDLDRTKYYTVQNSEKLLVVSSITRKQIEKQSKQNIN